MLLKINKTTPSINKKRFNDISLLISETHKSLIKNKSYKYTLDFYNANYEIEKADNIFNYIGVESVDQTIKKIEQSGGEILKPKSPIPSVGYYAFFKDTQGNRLGIIEEDESVK